MTKTKLLFTTFVIFMSLVFIYHLLEEKEIDKKSNDPPRHLDARDNSGLHQQSEEFGSNQTKDQPEPPFHKDKTSPSSPEELVYQEATLVKNQNNPHVNGGETERIVEKNTSDKTQLHAQGDSRYPDMVAAAYRPDTPNQEPGRFRADSHKLKDKSVEREEVSQSRTMTKRKVKELIFLSIATILILLLTMLLEKVSNNRA